MGIQIMNEQLVTAYLTDSLGIQRGRQRLRTWLSHPHKMMHDQLACQCRTDQGQTRGTRRKTPLHGRVPGSPCPGGQRGGKRTEASARPEVKALEFDRVNRSVRCCCNLSIQLRPPKGEADEPPPNGLAACGLSPHGNGSGGRTAGGRDQVHGGHRFLHDLPADVLREHIGGIVRAQDFAELERLAPDSVLDPEIRRGKVPDLAYALATAYSDCRSGIGVDAEAKVPAKVLEEGLETKGLGRSIRDPMELGLATAQ